MRGRFWSIDVLADHPRQIGMSPYSAMWNLRVVQVFAGRKNPSSTERYRHMGLEELKAAVRKHHPLG